jgi:hypothetical protein
MLASFAFSASALTPVNDEALSQVAGQDGVSIVADLHVNIGSFTYSDSGNTASMNGINVSGVLAATIDVVSGAQFQGAALAALEGTGLTTAQAGAVLAASATPLGFNMQDVIQIAIPAVSGSNGLQISVASMTTGHGLAAGNSMGGIALTNLDIGGTKVWMFGHN